ncbi:MBL fold metallo-hydrolase [Chloroflexota bacterium]
MKINWLGHAAFLITSDSGTRIITDPYKPGAELTYGDIDAAADIVTISHDQHGDHNNVSAVRGNPEVIGRTAAAKGIEFKGILTYHDDTQGTQRGNNTIFCFEVDGVKLCHIGDLGHPLSDAQAVELGEIDVLLLPVGGRFTIDVSVASQLCARLQPGVVIPMHYRNDKCGFLATGVDDFLQGKDNITRLNASEVEFGAGELPAATRIMVLKPAR